MALEDLSAEKKEEKRVKVKISGRVQGVFFRLGTVKKARELNLAGWVRNVPDGTVEILAEGEKEALLELLDWCKKGPRLAQVEEVEPRWEKASGKFSQFKAQHFS
jgi:acylphosphatase